MKKIIIILLLIPFTLTAQFELEEDYSFKTDKQFHAIAGIASSATIFYFVYKSTKDEALSKRAGIIFAVMLATGKEIIDMASGKEPSIADLAYTSAFAIATSISLEQFVKHRKRKVIKYSSKVTYSLDNEIFTKK